MNIIDILILLDSRLHYNVTVNPEEAVAFAQKVDSGLLGMIKEINSLIPKMDYGPNNPNTGQFHHNFKIGREYSRVVYLEFVKAYLPKDFNYLNLFDKLSKLSKIFRCDEFSIDNQEGSVSVRFWFD